jgi:hypothetical protein
MNKLKVILMKNKLTELVIGGIASIIFGFIGFIITDLYSSTKLGEIVYYVSSSDFNQKDTTQSKIVIVDITNQGNQTVEKMRCVFKKAKNVEIHEPNSSVVKHSFLKDESNETEMVFLIESINPNQTVKFTALIKNQSNEFNFGEKSFEDYLKIIISTNNGDAKKVDTTGISNNINKHSQDNYTIIVALLFLLVLVIVSFLIIVELRRIKYSTSFKTAIDMLQQPNVRIARGLVMDMYDSLVLQKVTEEQIKDIKQWTPEQIKAGDLVCATYDTVGIMVSKGLIPIDMVADNWGKSLRKTFAILKYLIDERRKEYGSGNMEYWDDYEKLAKVAENFKKTAK